MLCNQNQILDRPLTAGVLSAHRLFKGVGHFIALWTMKRFKCMKCCRLSLTFESLSWLDLHSEAKVCESDVHVII